MELIEILLMCLVLTLYAFLLSRWNKKTIIYYNYDRFGLGEKGEKFKFRKRILGTYIVKDLFDFIYRFVLEYLWLSFLLKLLSYLDDFYALNIAIAILFRIIYITIMHLIIRFKKSQNDNK